MTTDILELADRLWRGEASTSELHPFAHLGEMAEICEGVAFVPSFANVSAFETDDGLVLVDTGSAPLAKSVHQQLRRWSGGRLHTAVYSHGHIDHVFGVPVWEEESRANNWMPPTVIAHEALGPRFDRYIATAGYNQVVNRRQFGIKNLVWPTEYRYPDRTYASELHLDIGGHRFELRHEKGETDDHTVTWFPDRRVLCCGDLFIWASPNAGNPQKVQRYPREWAMALRRMLELAPEFLLPGHGLPVVGHQRVGQALADTAEMLDSLVDQTLELLNAGSRLDEAIHSVRVPAHLAERPFLQPVYDEPEFVVRNIWRLYGGWWDGNPASLQPATESALAVELAGLAGGATVLADRALDLLGGYGETRGAGGGSADGEPGGDDRALRLAGHLVELACLAAPSDPGVRRARQQVFTKRAERATSTMARGIFTWAAEESSVAEEPSVAGNGAGNGAGNQAANQAANEAEATEER